jgi:hypothetical protein
MPITPVEKKGPALGGLLSFAKGAIGAVNGAMDLPGAVSDAAKKVGGLFDAPDANLPDSTAGVAAPKEPGVEREEIPDGPPLSPMGRRMENDPHFGLHAGLEALADPNLNISDEDRIALAEPLARAKVFGKRGGLR